MMSRVPANTLHFILLTCQFVYYENLCDTDKDKPMFSEESILE
jgi:hypothetical protein